MKKFLTAAFNITLVQILLIVVLGVAKYLLDESGLALQIKTPFIILFAASLFSLLLTSGIVGHIENKGVDFDSWIEKHHTSKKHSFLSNFVKWAQIIPFVLGYLLFVYIIAPTSLAFFFAVLGGILLQNIYNYFSNEARLSGEASQRHKTLDSKIPGEE